VNEGVVMKKGSGVKMRSTLLLWGRVSALATVLMPIVVLCSCFLQCIYGKPTFRHTKINEELDTWTLPLQDQDFEVITIKKFLSPDDLALIMDSLSDAAVANDWLYTTNTGAYGDKVRSHDDILARRIRVEEANNRKLFSYSKHELPATHNVVMNLKSVFRRPDTMQSISAAFTNNHIRPRHMTELFIAKYMTDDFLSWHGDGPAGSFAFILSLTDGWDSSRDGGGLQFSCGDQSESAKTRYTGRFDIDDVCLELSPAFNTLTLFRTRYMSESGVMEEFPMLHRVDRVRADKARITVTGWYLCEGDRLSPIEAEICARMKGSSCLDE
jgi:hypothetical protein